MAKKEPKKKGELLNLLAEYQVKQEFIEPIGKAIETAIRESLEPLEPIFNEGVKGRKRAVKEKEGGKKGGEKSGIGRKTQATLKKDKWQKIANEEWKKHPNKKKIEIARIISKATGDPVNTIRQNIEKPALDLTANPPSTS